MHVFEVETTTKTAGGDGTDGTGSKAKATRRSMMTRQAKRPKAAAEVIQVPAPQGDPQHQPQPFSEGKRPGRASSASLTGAGAVPDSPLAVPSHSVLHGPSCVLGTPKSISWLAAGRSGAPVITAMPICTRTHSGPQVSAD
ncbi:hypothetical protein CDD82_4995 [Ophiocordyceps australis]|uniref:Uncharacterized protein n=1 Tax=Ophiocordyceps australis TaxID=1399860 RepID=A0A2C5Y4E0_9HYPO|nr:hypothetical protein CDD82_4995 [Ophiocordyceps australis]